MARKNSEDSSLELLLDTMCNTFGGVMFIAISLAVIIALKGPQQNNTPVPDPRERIESVKKEITKLKAELDSCMKKTESAARILKTMEHDPRMRLIHEIAFLERLCKEKKLSRSLVQKEVDLERSTLKNLEIKALKITEKLATEERKLKSLHTTKKRQELLLTELRNKLKKADLKNMVFASLVKKEDIPYFIFVDHGKVWAVGPEITQSSYTPNSAVTFAVKNGYYQCTPVPGKGIEIFQGKELSAEFRDFLKSIPQNRVPEFVISRNDAEVFYRLREQLKKSNTFHGFRVQSQDNDHFSFRFVNQKGSYEY